MPHFVRSIHQLWVGTVKFWGENNIVWMLRGKKPIILCSQEGKHSKSKGLGFIQFFIQDASPEYQLMSVIRFGSWPGT